MPAIQIFRKSSYVLAVVFLLYVTSTESVPAELHDYYPHPAHKVGECTLPSDPQNQPSKEQGPGAATSSPGDNTNRATSGSPAGSDSSLTQGQGREQASGSSSQQWGLPDTGTSGGPHTGSVTEGPPSGQEGQVTARPPETPTGRTTPSKDANKVVENSHPTDVGFWTGQEVNNSHSVVPDAKDLAQSHTGAESSQGNQGQISQGNQGGRVSQGGHVIQETQEGHVSQAGTENRKSPQDNNLGHVIQGGPESPPRQAGEETKVSQGRQVTPSWQVTPREELSPGARGDHLGPGGKTSPNEQVHQGERVTQGPQLKIESRTQKPAERVTSPGHETGDWPPLPLKPGTEEALKPCSSTRGCSTGVGGTDFIVEKGHHRPPIADVMTTPDTVIPRDPEARRDYMRELKENATMPQSDAPLPDASGVGGFSNPNANKNVVVDKPSEYVEGVQVVLDNADIHTSSTTTTSSSTTTTSTPASPIAVGSTNITGTKATAADRGSDSAGVSGSFVVENAVDDRRIAAGSSDGGGAGGGSFDTRSVGGGRAPSIGAGGENTGIEITGNRNSDGGNIPTGSIGSTATDSGNVGSTGGGRFDGRSTGSRGTESGNTGSGDVGSGSFGNGSSSGSAVIGIPGDGNGGLRSSGSGSVGTTSTGSEGLSMDEYPSLYEPHSNIPSDPEERRKYLQKLGSKKPSDPFSRKIFIILRDGLLPRDPVQRKRFLEENLYGLQPKPADSSSAVETYQPVKRVETKASDSQSLS